jgi:hypothetical protein
VGFGVFEDFEGLGFVFKFFGVYDECCCFCMITSDLKPKNL